MSPLEILIHILCIYLAYRITRTLVALVWAILIYVLAPLIYTPNLSRYKSRWTVVTGGTDGIGKAYTLELAKRGLNKFLLVGRNRAKLDDVANQLEREYGARVKVFEFDFSCLDEYGKLRQFLATIDIGFVVHSAGVGREKMEMFGENPAADRLILSVNALGAAEFLSIVLDPMERCGGGQIVVISSSQGYRPLPMIASYSAAKSLLSFLAESIDRERSNIRVQCLTPALVATKMTFYDTTSSNDRSMWIVSPEAFANSAAGTLGLVTTTTGCFNHEIQMLLRHLFPWRILKHLVTPIYLLHKRRTDAIFAEKNKLTRGRG